MGLRITPTRGARSLLGQPSKRWECDPDGRTYRTDATLVSPWPALSFAIMLQPGAFRSIGSILLTEATLFHRRHL
jgi:hypothetical protein